MVLFLLPCKTTAHNSQFFLRATSPNFLGFLVFCFLASPTSHVVLADT